METVDVNEMKVAEAIQGLYGGAPDGFVAARNELAERLKSAGDPGLVKQVMALRKPTVAAWAVDRIAVDRAGEVEALIRAGNDLASAQREVAAGGSPERLREATAERRRLVDQLVRASKEIMLNAGLPAARATLDKVSDTLMAIATDQEAGERVRRGVLEKELPPRRPASATSGWTKRCWPPLASCRQPRAPRASLKARRSRRPSDVPIAS